VTTMCNHLHGLRRSELLVDRSPQHAAESVRRDVKAKCKQKAISQSERTTSACKET
jgi:hypothetical protein